MTAMSNDRLALKGMYARLKGLERAMPQTYTVPLSLVRDYENLVAQLGRSFRDDDFTDFSIPHDSLRDGDCVTKIFESKLLQLISYLESVYNVSREIVEIGSLYNSIKDEQLRARCSDLLSAPGSFDRVINQATQVLEDRIRTKSRNQDGLTGAQLVNKVLVSDVTKTVLKVSDDADEHRGYCDIARGMMAAFRNQTHHRITEKFTREDALKVCAFVDSLLRVIDQAQVKS